jgi:DNA-binding phage protein
MLLHPYLSSQIARDRQQEMLASAAQHHLARQLRAQSRQARQAGRTRQRLHRALRTATRLRPAARA